MKTLGSIGTISHGTMRSEDLLEAFADELEYLCKANDLPVDGLVQEARDVDPEDYGDETVSELIDDLIDALNEFAPPYCYFGAHEGDGSDYGFWPSIEAIEELPAIDDNSDEAIAAATAGGEDCRYVNDHGNVTVYGRDGVVILELV